MMPNMSYSTRFLMTIGSLAKQNFNNFYIPQLTRARIIALGIRKQHKPYRRSRAGQNLFYHIQQRITFRQENRMDTSRKQNLSLMREIPKSLNKHQMINISHVNARSIINKVNQFQLEICERNTDICAITETWIKQDDIDSVTKEVPPQGYRILSRSRSGGKTGGGVALVYRDHYSVKELDQIEVITMEYQGYQLRFDHITLILYIIYRLPSSSVLQFCNEFASILERDVSQPADKVLYLGDFNIHVDNSYNNDTITFMDILDSYNLKNRITFPTHVGQHQLDLVIEDQTDSIITKVERGFLLSDHYFIHTSIRILNPKPQEVTVQFRKMKSIDHNKFNEDLKITLQRTEPIEDLQDLVAAYNSVLLSTLDIHAPLKIKRVKKYMNNHGSMTKLKEKSYLDVRKRRPTTKNQMNIH